MSKKNLLIVEDDHSYRAAMASAMSSRGFEVASMPNGSAALAWLSHNACDAMLLDLKLPDINGMEVLHKTQEQFPDIEIVVLTGHGTIETAIEAIRFGAFHFLTKPCDPDEIELVLNKALEHQELLKRTMVLEDGLAPPDMSDTFIGQSSQHREILNLINRIAPTDSSVLILGETGVGKELVAKLIHARSRRRNQPFVVVDCASLHENLLQSELFGHEKGAYTGANRLKHGLFSVADKGTIFLDEIGDISPSLQAKLLRVLENGTFRRLGGTSEISVDVRALAATNRDLPEMVAQGHFREDLFYRLNTIKIQVPPLRERPADIACLIGHFINRFNERFGQAKKFSPEAMQILLSFPWPGNVRQLTNVVEQAVVLSDGPSIMPAHLPAHMQSSRSSALPTLVDHDFVSLRNVERHYIEFVIKQMDGHRAKAAKALGIGERSLYRKLKQYGIE